MAREMYTTAPSDYDYTAWTSELNSHVGTTSNGKVVRKVLLDMVRGDFQIQRYASGLHPCWDQSEFDKNVEYGFVVLHND